MDKIYFNHYMVQILGIIHMPFSWFSFV